MSDKNALIDELAAWSLLSHMERVSAGVPTDFQSWAKAKGVSDRSVRSWRKSPEFEAAVANAEANRSAGRPMGTVPTLPEGRVVSDQAEYRFIKATEAMTKGLEAGDPKYLDLYLRHEGKEFLEAARQTRESKLGDLSDQQLVAGFLDSVEEPLVAGFLAARGWVCRPPEPVSGTSASSSDEK